MKHITLGMTAHADAGKTTLSEAMLFLTGGIRKKGRVDNGDSWLDTGNIEREKGITVFTHQASFDLGDKRISLLDTPGHADFSAETERTLRVLDYAVVVISASEGVQSHTLTIWKLLEKYDIPVFIFVNKTDLPGAGADSVMRGLREKLSTSCTDFSRGGGELAENCSMSSDLIMEKYLGGEEITDADIAGEIAKRRIFPCCFGSALRNSGVEEFLNVLDRYLTEPVRSESSFGAKVYKISVDTRGARLTFMKVCSGKLDLRDEIAYTAGGGEKLTEKVTDLRFYSGEKYKSAQTAVAGEICAVTGLSATYPGLGLGSEKDCDPAVLEPVMYYRLRVPEGADIYKVLDDMKILGSEDPQLHVTWNARDRGIDLGIMGDVQAEVLTKIIRERFGYDVAFENGSVAYRETIAEPVKGVGHYEPLRHYAEVHLLLEPLERGSGLQFALRCGDDGLDRNYRRLVLTHLEEKTHIGVLTGSPVTDMKISLVSGKSHEKHTEGGDFRQAVCRAVRQGLRSAKSVLLEPYCAFTLEVPDECMGRAMTDLKNMYGTYDLPRSAGGMTVLNGYAPVSEINGYPKEISSYTGGRGTMTLTPAGYRECHNAESVIKKIGYDCDSDLENTADSVFCSHGAGVIVRWDKVQEYMHLPSYFSRADSFGEEIDPGAVKQGGAGTSRGDGDSDEELMKIFERTYGRIERDPRKAFRREIEDMSDSYRKVRLPGYSGPEYLLVDGYNIIFAWDDLRKLAEKSLDLARGRLSDILCSYRAFRQCEVILVFDAYKVKGHDRDVERYCNINIVYTRESETADSYIERVTHDLSKDHRVRVATSDGLEQVIILGNGARRVPASELLAEVRAVEREIRGYMKG